MCKDFKEILKMFVTNWGILIWNWYEKLWLFIHSGRPVIFMELSKSATNAYPLRLYDPAEGSEESEDADALAER